MYVAGITSRLRGLIAACALGVVPAGCVLISDFDGLVGPGATSHGGAGGSAAESSGSGGAAPCSDQTATSCNTIPRFVGGPQELDGIGDDLCSLPHSELVVVQGQYRKICPPPAFMTPDIRATVRVGWSDAAFHAHVHVDKVPVAVAPDDNLYSGDCVEIFIAPTAKATGDLSQDHAGHYLIAPPAGALPARITANNGPVLKEHEQWAARLVDGGYEVELEVPWELLAPGAPPAAGQNVLYDLAVDVADPAGGASYQSLLHYEDYVAHEAIYCADGSSPGTEKPSLSDLSWCTPVLSPQ